MSERGFSFGQKTSFGFDRIYVLAKTVFVMWRSGPPNKINDEDIKRTLLLNSCDEKSCELSGCLCIRKNRKRRYLNQLVNLFDDHFATAKLVLPKRRKFYSAVKAKDETVQEWAARVRMLALKCEFENTKIETVLRD
ncbi:hypothetical protein NQ317_014250 [Molorchus minor]|uniref:Uncharacterized protein n=1 Tax=Molorchus minor TaxID=1323400 RepID=A0ABQ9J5X4_9CUCU|nr:hypothetical protein NQ317_014250 [Molorchus minor]